ncbi:protein phosphatase 2C domain-containing protein [Streptomyces sp. 8N706]|uniref:protein phosphatase 2C domain-containing protein n=1 Tax=Streptomyces sp. 8N706 TaxID=3457416 RepID=UPI003FCF26D6
MSQPGERYGHEDDWWRELYDEDPPDTGPAPAGDSLDDRFDSASRTVGSPPGGPVPDPSERGPYAAGSADLPQRAAEEGEWWQGSPSLPDAGKPAGPAPEEWPEPTWPPPGGRAPAGDAGRPRPGQERFPSPPPSAGPRPSPDESWPTAGPESPPHGPPHSARPEPPLHGPLPSARSRQAPDEPSPARPSAPARPSPPGRGPDDDEPASVYADEPTALPAADPGDLDDLVPDTVLDGARYGSLALRAVSTRGQSARHRGEPRRDALLTARFGSGDRALLLVAVATGTRAAEGAHRAAGDACRWIGAAVGRSHARLAEDIRAGRRGALKAGLHRLTDRSYGRLRARAGELGLAPADYSATLRCLLLPADPACRVRVFFGVGEGGLFRLREGAWQDIEPAVREADTRGGPVVGYGSAAPEQPDAGDRLTVDLGVVASPPSGGPAPGEPAPAAEPFRFRASVACPGDTLLLCSAGLAAPLRGEPALAGLLAERWAPDCPPGLPAFLADLQLRAQGYGDDRTAAAVWEA